MALTDTAQESQLPPEVIEIKNLARRIVRDELLPLEPRYIVHPGHGMALRARDALRSVFAEDVVDRLYKISNDTGLWGINIPEDHGGSGLSMLAKVAIMEEFYYTAVPFPFAEVSNILLECKGEQIATYLQPTIDGTKIAAFGQTEANAGSDPGGMMQTRAMKDGDYWVLNGSKMWISNADVADFIMVQAVTDPALRQRGGITMFLVDKGTPGMNVVTPGQATWLGSRATQFIVNFDNCRVHESVVLGEVGKGFTLGQNWLMFHDRLMRGPFCLGKMQRALDMCITWSKQRVTFGKPLSDRQSIQWKLVDMYVAIRSLRAMIYEAARLFDSGQEARYEAAMIKLCAAEWGSKVLDEAIQIHGAMGESLELPLSMFYRYVRHARIGGGTSEIQRMLIARMLLRD